VRVLFAMFGAVALAAAIVGCGGTTPAGSGNPGTTLAPGATATLGPVSSPGITPAGTGGVAVTGHECDAVPTFSVGNPNPSFPPDSALLAKFPTTVDGQPVTDVSASPWLYFLCLGGQNAFNQAASSSGGVNLATMSFGGFTANVDGEDVDVFAFRQPGADGNTLAQTIASLAAASGNPIDVGQVSTATVGGKSVYTWTDSDGNKGYGYVSGDTLISFDSVTDSQASKIVSALP
jgi:hypothetical protein